MVSFMAFFKTLFYSYKSICIGSFCLISRVGTPVVVTLQVCSARVKTIKSIQVSGAVKSSCVHKVLSQQHTNTEKHVAKKLNKL